MGFVLFGITNDGAKPYGIILTQCRSRIPGKAYRTGTPAKSDGKFPETKEYRIVPLANRSVNNHSAPSILRASRFQNRYPIFSGWELKKETNRLISSKGFRL